MGEDASGVSRLEELEVLYREAPVGLSFVDRELRFRRLNERMAEIHGRPLDAHIGATVEEVIPEIADQYVPVYRRILATGEPVRNLRVRGTLPSKPDTLSTWLVTHYPAKDERAGVSGIMTVVQDITELERAMEELHRVKEHLAAAQRVAGVGSWEWDIIADVVWWSQELYRILDRDEESFAPSLNAFFDLVHPDDRPAIRKQLDATLERDDPYAIEFRTVLENGTVRLLEAHAVLERTREGAPARLIGTARDITDERIGRDSARIVARETTGD